MPVVVQPVRFELYLLFVIHAPRGLNVVARLVEGGGGELPTCNSPIWTGAVVSREFADATYVHDLIRTIYSVTSIMLGHTSANGVI